MAADTPTPSSNIIDSTANSPGKKAPTPHRGGRLRTILLTGAAFVVLASILANSRIAFGFGAAFRRPVAKSAAPLLRARATASTRVLSSSAPVDKVTMAHPEEKRPKPPQAPPLFTHDEDGVLAACRAIIDRRIKLYDELTARTDPEDATWENTMVPRLDLEAEEYLEITIPQFYNAVSADEKLREASSEGSELLGKAETELTMRQDAYERFDAVYKKRHEFNLDAESLRLLDKDHRSYIKEGLGLPAGPQRDRFKAIRNRQTELTVQFQKALNEEDGGLWFAPAQLDGLSADVLGRLAKGEGENEGKVRVTFKYPDLFPVMNRVKSGEVQKEMFMANDNKIKSNSELIKEMLALRDEAARLLGYPDHATCVIEDKMAKSPAVVNEFLGDLRKRLAPGGKVEVNKLLELKKAESAANGGGEEDAVYLWEWRFYKQILKEKEFQIDEQKIAEYFPLDSSVSGMLSIFESLFGLRFYELDEADKAAISPSGRAVDVTWHESVIMFSVWDDEGEGGGFVGYMYLDLHPRTGKYAHAANFNLQPGFLKKDGSRHYPATALVCNFTPPTAKKPSLLQHDEVVTLFHELGHAIHNLVGRSQYPRFHGTSTVNDFVEAPSQMLENWCWTPLVLRKLSRHWESAEPLPDDLIDNLVRTYHVNEALANLRQLHFGIFDMTLHQPASHEEAKSLVPNVIFNKLRAEIIPVLGPDKLGLGFDWGHGEASFGHLMGGYDAGYYGYLYSQVYSMDMFYTAFKKDPMNGKMGRKYRRSVLQWGGARDEMESLVEFLGRKPSSEAFYKELGLSD